MSTIRKPVARPRHPQFTPEVLALWRRLRAIQDASGVDAFESDGGNRREYLDGMRQLCRCLGVDTWRENPLDADGPDPPDYMHHNRLRFDGWLRGWRLRLQLEGANRQE
jgi:hypothetical protein